MKKRIELSLLPQDALDDNQVRQAALRKLGWENDGNVVVRLLRRSIDARKRPVYRLLLEVAKDETPTAESALLDALQDISEAKYNCIIVGAGPAGYFAALELIELGIRPIILERGKDVRSRRRDLRAIQQFGQVDPHSNYCFGEGGAGTYSDGKLYTRSHKRGKIEKALRLLVEHGAQSDILVDAHPHIGSNKLPNVVANIRETILHYGGEIHFGECVTDFMLHGGKILGVVTESGQEYHADATILATGHSARDIFQLLHSKGIRMEAKPFALGVRIEHPQPLVDEIQYGQSPRDENLPASSYKLVCQVRQRGVFSFCMCPGGLVVPAATAPGEIVVNGMSMSKRDSPFANSGTVVAVELEDLLPYQEQGIFAGLALQKEVEQAAFQYGDGSQKAPAQRLIDFAEGRISKDLSASSYIPGLLSAPVHELLPLPIARRLQEAVQVFGRKMKGYYTQEANVIATESRTSSPIRIPREKDSYMHPEVEAFFPAGEGAGYAGGIISAAMDGQNVAQAVRTYLGLPE